MTDTTNTDNRRRPTIASAGASNVISGVCVFGSAFAAIDAGRFAVLAAYIRYFLKDGETMEKNKSQAQERWAAKYFESEA